MRKSGLYLIWALILIKSASITLYASDRHWIFFKDKGHYQEMTLSEQEEVVNKIISDIALERRFKRSEPSLKKKTLIEDLPLEESYIQAIEQTGFKIHGKSRWFNAISGTASPEVLKQIRSVSFVKSVKPVKGWTYESDFPKTSSQSPLKRSGPTEGDELDYGESDFQIKFHNINSLHEMGLTGEGVIIAMMDTGFRLTHPALEHIKSQLIAEYDFVQRDSVTSNQLGDLTNQDSHGTLTLSTIAGYVPGLLIGPAFDAQFLLAKTEDISVEIHMEEDNWTEAAEWVESKGVDVVSSSLGYSIFDKGEGNYAPADMDGETAIITRAANKLARRGVLVVSSAGNEGNGSWHIITAPADGFKVLTVGALNSENQVAGFSSRGPTADGRIKPDVSALGVNVFGAVQENVYIHASGTSLSCPLVAGIAAQILQKHPEISVPELIEVFHNSGDNRGNPDNVRGWGKVNALTALFVARDKMNENMVDKTVYPPYPNPFITGEQSLTFLVNLSETSLIELDIFNILGQNVASVDYNGFENLNSIFWDGRNYQGHQVPAGVYIYRIRTDQIHRTGKIVILN